MSRKIGGILCLMGVFGALPSIVQGAINLELRPAIQIVNPGDSVSVGLFAVSGGPAGELMAAADVILGWNPSLLRLLGRDNTGAVPLLVSGFPVVDPYGINEVIPPQDGNGLYIAYALVGQPVAATPSGTLLTTFRFYALAETSATQILILPSAGSPVGHTTVYDGTVAGLDVTGTLGTATVVIQDCGDGDINNDGDLDMDDINLFVAVLLGFDTDPAHIAAADVNCSDVVNGLDIQPFINGLLTGA